MMEQRCGNCAFWELSGYARNNDIESGVGGHHCDGSVSNCRRHAPAMVDMTRDRIHDRAEWPTTRNDAWCGDWSARAVRIEPAEPIKPLRNDDPLRGYGGHYGY